MSALSWKTILARRLPLLGHRNWIGVVDSAYPWQTAPGIETIATGTEHLTVLKFVCDAIRNAKHVRPVAHLDAELAALCDETTPGASPLRMKIQRLLDADNVSTAPHDEIIGRLDQAARHFRVLLLKTSMTIPYTSVFFELECGYWSAPAERTLRASFSK